jgi:hypothetical protein
MRNRENVRIPDVYSVPVAISTASCLLEPFNQINHLLQAQQLRAGSGETGNLFSFIARRIPNSFTLFPCARIQTTSLVATAGWQAALPRVRKPA